MFFVRTFTSQLPRWNSFSSKIKQKIRVASLHELSFLPRVREIPEAISPKGKDLGPPGLKGFLVTLWTQECHLPFWSPCGLRNATYLLCASEHLPTLVQMA